MAGTSEQQSIRITLRGRQNVTYTGTLILSPNWTSNNWDGAGSLGDEGNDTVISEDGKSSYDQAGASYYVIAVVLVYGMSIVMLIASHIKRRNEKLVEDKQINKYLQDFQIVKERHARDSYKNLKRTIMKKINWDKQKKPTYQNLQKSIMPLLAIGMPGAEVLSDADTQSLSSSLSNVDLAAAEQYMIAKDKGKVIHTKSYDLTAAYFAAARRVTKDQSPQTLARICKCRRLSRDHGVFAFSPGYMDRHAGFAYFPNKSRTSSCEEPVIEEPEPQSAGVDISTSDHESQNMVEAGDAKILSKCDMPKLPCSISEVKVDVTPMDCSTAKILSGSKPPNLHFSSAAQPEPQVSNVWYVNQVGPKESTSPSPTDAKTTFPVNPSRSSSRGSGCVPGNAVAISPKESPHLSSSSRTTTPVLSDGSREELIQITCL